MRMKADGTGKLAIFDETVNGNDPFTDPGNHVDETRFHTDFGYVEIVSELTGTLNISDPQSEAAWGRMTQHLVGAHGLNYIPWVWGEFDITYTDSGDNTQSATVPSCGSVPHNFLQRTVAAAYGGLAQWLLPCADLTHVYVSQFTPALSNYYTPTTVDYRIWITDLSIS